MQLSYYGAYNPSNVFAMVTLVCSVSEKSEAAGREGRGQRDDGGAAPLGHDPRGREQQPEPRHDEHRLQNDDEAQQFEPLDPVDKEDDRHDSEADRPDGERVRKRAGGRGSLGAPRPEQPARAVGEKEQQQRLRRAGAAKQCEQLHKSIQSQK
jgi:hypothetical protein